MTHIALARFDQHIHRIHEFTLQQAECGEQAAASAVALPLDHQSKQDQQNGQGQRDLQQCRMEDSRDDLRPAIAQA